LFIEIFSLGFGDPFCLLSLFLSYDAPSAEKAFFTPLESPAIYGEDDIDVNFIPYRKVRVKALLFLTG
jgi:hypothetical protein